MGRRSIIILSAAFLIILVSAVIILFDTVNINKLSIDSTDSGAPPKQAGNLSGDLSREVIMGNVDNQGVSPSETADWRHDEEGGSPTEFEVSNKEELEIIKSEEIKVYNNSPEFELNAYLCKNRNNEEFIKFEYYNDGVTTIKELGKDKVPELEGIFDKMEDQAVNNGGHRIKAVYLNAMYNKAYFILEGKGNKAEDGLEGFNTFIMYSYNLKDFALKKVYSDIGSFTELMFSKNQKYAGFSYFDSPVEGIYREKSILQIVKCENDSFIVKGSRTTAKNKLIGGVEDAGFIHDYQLLSWQSNTSVKLRASIWAEESSEPKSGEAMQMDVVYDLEKDQIMDTGGKVITSFASIEKVAGHEEEKPADHGDKGAATGNAGAAGSGDSADSEPVALLKDFYSCLASEKDYNRALDMLSDDFTLELNILKQFGIGTITKGDLDAESASMYADILKNAKLDSIVKEEVSGGTSTVQYFQSFTLDGETQIKVPIVAKLKKLDGSWKIISASEIENTGDIDASNNGGQ